MQVVRVSFAVLLARRLERLLARRRVGARALAQRLGKGDIEVEIEHGDLFEAPRAFAGFWSSIAHVIRNAIDHGLETPDERQAAGKGAPTVRFSAQLVGHNVHIVVADDGKGIAWDRLRDKAAAAGVRRAIEALAAAAARRHGSGAGARQSRFGKGGAADRGGES